MKHVIVLAMIFGLGACAGPRGNTGAQGATGATGAQGEQGAAGAVGPAGASASFPATLACVEVEGHEHVHYFKCTPVANND